MSKHRGSEYLKRKQARRTAKVQAAKKQKQEQLNAEQRARIEAAVQHGLELARLHPVPTQAEYIANPEKYGAVQRFSKETWEKNAHSLSLLFNPSPGFLTKNARHAVYELIMCCKHFHTDMIVKLAEDFISNRPPSNWLSPYNPWKDDEIKRGADLHLFHGRRHEFIKQFDRHFARYLIQERRLIKKEREKALAFVLLTIANSAETKGPSQI